METSHRVRVGDARAMDRLPDDRVELVVTSPPYPMIDLWDETFAALEPAVADHLDDGDGAAAFEAMHRVLDGVWDEVARVLADGGLACVNVGDATRSVDGSFARYDNHGRVTSALRERGLRPLPGILWRKPTNSLAKFMGSGMLPPNAYPTLEHEHVLLFRNGDLRSLPGTDDRRSEAAYFWEERNRWFSDLWTDLGGRRQDSDDPRDRDRSGAFPFDLPYRLVNMFSVYGDTVLDPFLGTGTTSVAAMVAGRNSIGYELDAGLVDSLGERLGDVPARSRAVIDDRLEAHREFVADAEDDAHPHEARNYDFPVRSKQERDVQFYAVDRVGRRPVDGDGLAVELDHEPR